MKTIFLTSDIGASKKLNGTRIPCQMNNTNGLIEQIKACVKNFENFVFIVSNPAGEKNDKYANVTFESFKMSGIGFKNLTVLDNRNRYDAEKIIKSADLVFLSGGFVPIQNKFFEEINLKKFLASFDGVIIGQSAGSMNLAKKVYKYPESLNEIGEPKFLEGLGLTDFTIVPHFDTKKGTALVDGDIDLMNDYFKKDSFTLPLCCITDFSHIKIENGKPKFYGEIYLMKDGTLSRPAPNNSNPFKV